MITTNLTATNIIRDTDLILEIESKIGTEIINVYTYSPWRILSHLEIMPGRDPFKFIRNTPWFKCGKFCNVSKTITYFTRKKWARSFIKEVYQLEIVGYKLPTTHIDQGFIYGNPVRID